MNRLSLTPLCLAVTCQLACTAPVGGGHGTSSDGGPIRTADGGLTAMAPELTSARVQVSGRAGKDLLVSFVGTDQNINISALTVRLLDAEGVDVVAIDTNHDGVVDSAEGPLSIEAPHWVGEVLTASGVLRGLFSQVHPISQVKVTLQDATGLRSASQTVRVVDQPVMAMGQSCDPLFVASRCPPSVGCRGTPPSCQEGLPPTITRMAFYRGTGGPTILIEGKEPEDDLAIVKFEFQSAAGLALSIDSDGNGTPDLTTFAFEATGASVDGQFFIRMQAGEGLDLQVPKLLATPSDQVGHTGTAITAAPTTVPVRSAGQACDARGFDVCAPSLVCAPGFVGQANRCTASAGLHTTQCKAAPVLVPTADGASLFGVAEGVSLWDAPSGCSTNDPKGRPEGLVTVRLAQRANQLTVTTARPGTNFDTVLYALSGCPNDSSMTYGCSDDVPGARGASTLVLHDLPAGDYLMVIDSFDFIGGSFEVLATVE